MLKNLFLNIVANLQDISLDPLVKQYNITKYTTEKIDTIIIAYIVHIKKDSDGSSPTKLTSRLDIKNADKKHKVYIIKFFQ